eukprot:6207876-Pleurochrysis_carterae.AAC.3
MFPTFSLHGMLLYRVASVARAALCKRQCECTRAHVPLYLFVSLPPCVCVCVRARVRSSAAAPAIVAPGVGTAPPFSFGASPVAAAGYVARDVAQDG